MPSSNIVALLVSEIPAFNHSDRPSSLDRLV